MSQKWDNDFQEWDEGVVGDFNVFLVSSGGNAGFILLAAISSRHEKGFTLTQSGFSRHFLNPGKRHCCDALIHWEPVHARVDHP